MTAMPTLLPQVATNYYAQQQATTREASEAAQRIWRLMPQTNLRDKWRWFSEVEPLLARIMRQGQAENVKRSAEYLLLTSMIQGVPETAVADLILESFVSPDDVARNLVRQPMVKHTSLLTRGFPDDLATRQSTFSMITMLSLQVQDAGREAVGVGIAATPTLTGYYRKLTLPSCKRCAVLSGKWFEKNADFDRHPGCDCTAIPATEQYDDAANSIDSIIDKGGIKDLTRAEVDAIARGGDANAVINASRAKYRRTTSIYGREVDTTLTRAGLKPRRGDWWWLPEGTRRPPVRLTPSAIYKLTSDSDELTRLLKLHGYIR